jgi:hypothetical protein
MTDKELYKHLIDEYKGDDLAGHLAHQMQHIRETKASIASIKKEKQMEMERHEKAMKDLDAKIKGVQGICRHLARTYYPDPSGNNDSYYECDHCGRSL